MKKFCGNEMCCGKKLRSYGKTLCSYGDEFARQSTWKDFALIKLCLCAAGFMLGAAAPKKLKKPLVFGAMAVFIATYLPLMTKFFDIVIKGKKEA